MLEAAGGRQIGEAYVRSRFVVDRDVHVRAVERARMVFATRFVPALPEPPRDVVVLWFIVAGTRRAWSGSTRPSSPAPMASARSG